MDASPTPMLLVLRALKLGDLLVAVPALRGLRRAWPAHRLVLASPGWLRPIVELTGAVDELLPTPGLDEPLPLAPGLVDVAVNLHGDGPDSARLIAALAARVVVAHRPHGVPAALAPEWRPELHERERWARLVNAFGAHADPEDVGLLRPEAPPAAEGAVLVHVGAFHGARHWPVERFGEVARALAAHGELLVTGSPAEADRVHAVVSAAGLPASAGRTDLDLVALAATVRAARLLVSADCGVAHLASAYRTPSVVLFGPAAPEQWGPPAGPHRVLTRAEERRGDVFAADPDPALLGVGVREVLEAAEGVLAAPAG